MLSGRYLHFSFCPYTSCNVVVNHLTVWLGVSLSKFSLQGLANFLKGCGRKYLTYMAWNLCHNYSNLPS